jgi:nickel-dependent lactate racemase
MATVRLPWGAWYEDSHHQVDLPSDWQITVIAPYQAAACDRAEIAARIEEPLGSLPPRELARNCQSACIAVDDLARPTNAFELLPPLIEQLHKAGLPVDRIRIVIAAGSHTLLDEQQIAKKVGREMLARYSVECHNCRANLAGTGIQYGERELQINRTFYEAEFKAVIGCTLPHSFAGHSGGAKLVLPGLADLQATGRSHKFVQLGLRGGSDPNSNRFRLEAEQLVRQLGLTFGISVLTGARRETAAVFAGDFVQAHREAARAAGDAYRCDLMNQRFDCLLLNAYPKDIDLVQAENVFISLGSAADRVLEPRGVVVLTTAASEGLGHHGLFEPGGLNYVAPRPKRQLAGRDLWIYAPSLDRETVHKLYCSDYPVFRSSESLIHALTDRLPSSARVAVLPCAPMQQIA